MKKKIKIFTTIASLCLAVALMAFGVYAANSISFQATSNVTFVATEIDGSWNLKVEKVWTGTGEGSDTVVLDYAENPYVKSNGQADRGEDVGTDGAGTVTAVKPVDAIGLSYDYATVRYTLKFINDGSKEAKIAFTLVDLSSEALAYGYTLTADENNAETVAGGDTAEFVFVLALNTAESNTGFNPAVEVTAVVDITAVASAN
jgi:hypothetical protein